MKVEMTLKELAVALAGASVGTVRFPLNSSMLNVSVIEEDGGQYVVVEWNIDD